MQINPLPYLLMLESLHLRLPSHHPKYPTITDHLNRERSGLIGEKQLIFPLKKMDFYNQQLFLIRLPLNNTFFQVDALVLTPRFILVIESKFYSDQVELDSQINRVIQSKEGEMKVYDDPVLQVEEQKYQLQLWLQLLGLPDIPIETLAVLTNPKCIPRIDSKYRNKIILLSRLPSRIREISSQYSKQYLSTQELHQIRQMISQANQPYVTYPKKRFGIEVDDLIKGVFCINCGQLGMKMVRMRWECPNCMARNNDAYLNVVKDWYLLNGPTITNGELRNFSGLESVYSANNMLRRCQFKKKGDRRHTVYELEFNYQEDFKYLFQLKRKKGNYIG